MRTKNIAMILTMALTAGLCQTAAPSQAATPKLSAKKLTIKIGKTAALKVKKTSKKAKWSIVSGKKNIRLTAKKKTSVKVKDQIRKTLLLQVGPPGVKVSVVDVAKAVRVYNNPKYEKDTVFFLYTCPQDVLRMAEAGVPIKSVNIGGMAFKTGKTQITRSFRRSTVMLSTSRTVDFFMRGLPQKLAKSCSPVR